MIKTEYGFDGVYIIPNIESSSVKSRRKVDTSITLNLNDKDIKFDMPLMLSPMSFFGSDAIRKVNNRFLTFIPRIKPHQFVGENKHLDYSDISIRLNEAKKLYEEGYNFGVAIGLKDSVEDVVKFQSFTGVFLVDVASGYSSSVHEYIKELRKTLPYSIIIAGNVVSRSGCKSLINAGSDLLRLSIGTGSNCQTSTFTSIGRPPLSMLQDISVYINSNKLIMDGGIKSSHDLCLALLYSSWCMVSGLFKNTKLNTHYAVSIDNFMKSTYELKIKSYGMSSEFAKSGNDYIEGKLTHGDPEDFELKYKQLKEGLQSAMSYLGAHNLNEYRNAKYELVYGINY